MGLSKGQLLHLSGKRVNQALTGPLLFSTRTSISANARLPPNAFPAALLYFISINSGKAVVCLASG